MRAAENILKCFICIYDDADVFIFTLEDLKRL